MQSHTSTVYVTSTDHVIKGSGNMGGRPSWLVTILPSLVAIGTVEVEI